MIGITDGRSAASALEAFERAIDRSCPADRSVVLRYRRACRLGEDPAADTLEPLLARTSLGEGMRVVPLFVHRGVTVEALDSTSLMATHTHKSVDGCVTTAHCLRAGHRRILFESGGNTGAALTLYASRAGIETFLFHPRFPVDIRHNAKIGREVDRRLAAANVELVHRGEIAWLGKLKDFGDLLS